MWLKEGHLGLASQQASVVHGIQFPLEDMGYSFAETG